MPAGFDSEQLESTSRKQEDAWGPYVPQSGDTGGQGGQHHSLHPWLLPKPVSFARKWQKMYYIFDVNSRFKTIKLIFQMYFTF